MIRAFRMVRAVFNDLISGVVIATFSRLFKTGGHF